MTGADVITQPPLEAAEIRHVALGETPVEHNGCAYRKGRLESAPGANKPLVSPPYGYNSPIVHESPARS